MTISRILIQSFVIAILSVFSLTAYAEPLNDAIKKLFPERAKVGTFPKPEFSICNSIRLERNINFHGQKSPDEVTTEEIEYFISGIKYIIKRLI